MGTAGEIQWLTLTEQVCAGRGMVKTGTKAVAMRKEELRIESYLRTRISSPWGSLNTLHERERETERMLRFLMWKFLWVEKSLRRNQGTEVRAGFRGR